MSVNEHKRVAMQALSEQLASGDECHGGGLYWSYEGVGTSPLDYLQEQWGVSGKTRLEVLKEHEAERAKIRAAMAWLAEVA